MTHPSPNGAVERVLLVNGNYEDGTVGGTQVHTRLLAHSLRDAGLTVGVLCQGETDGMTVVDGVQVYRVSPPTLPGPMPRSVRHAVNQTLAIQNPFIRSRAASVVRRFDPDLCHVHMLRRLTPAVLEVLRARRLPVVQTVHELFSLWNFDAYMKEDTPAKIHTEPTWPVFALKRWHRRLSATVQHVCAPSAFALGAYLDDGYFEGVPSSVLPLSVPFEWGDPSEAAHRRAARSPDRQPQLLFMGRLDNYKGVHEILAAAELLRDVDFKLDIAGDGVLGPLVAEHARHDERIVYHGAVEGARRRELYSRADVVLCPSTWTETFGYVVLEAYAAGLPVIASRVGALPDIVQHHETGLLVEPGSVPELAAAIRTMADSRTRQAMGLAAAQWITLFQAERPIEALLNVYRMAADRERSETGRARPTPRTGSGPGPHRSNSRERLT